MRTQINIPIKIYKNVVNVAEKIDMPVSSLISIMVMDTLQKPFLKIEKEERQRYDDDDYKKINLTFNDYYYYGKMLEVIQQVECSYTELILLCIEFQLKTNFAYIFQNTNNNHAKNMRILHQDKIGGGGRNYEFHEDTINRVKNEKKPIEKYVEKKADNWNVKPKAVKNYYIAQAINAVMKSCPAEIDMFCSPEEYISSDDL